MDQSKDDRNGRPWGLYILGSLYALTGITGTISNLIFLFKPVPGYMSELIKYDPAVLWPLMCSFSVMISFISIVVGVHIIRRDEKWRKVGIFVAGAAVAYWLAAALFLSKQPETVLKGGIPILDIILLVYLTRKPVIALFRETGVTRPWTSAPKTSDPQ